MKGGLEIVAVNDPFLDVEYMVCVWVPVFHAFTRNFVQGAKQ